MNTIRWTFTDRRTGNQVTVPHPTNQDERDILAKVLHNLAS